MNRYRILNRITKKWWEGFAYSAQEACQRAGWVIGDCWVRQYSPPLKDPSRDSGYKYGGWKTPDDMKPQKKGKTT